MFFRHLRIRQRQARSGPPIELGGAPVRSRRAAYCEAAVPECSPLLKIGKRVILPLAPLGGMLLRAMTALGRRGAG